MLQVTSVQAVLGIQRPQKGFKPVCTCPDFHNYCTYTVQHKYHMFEIKYTEQVQRLCKTLGKSQSIHRILSVVYKYARRSLSSVDKMDSGEMLEGLHKSNKST